MRRNKLYNVIFPIWFILFFPPVIFLTLIGNFIIDSLVIVACYYLFKLINKQYNLKTFYIKNIFKVWIFGFIADIIGVSIIFLLGTWGSDFGLSYKVVNGICYDPFSNLLSVIIIVFSMLLSVVLIFIFNHKFTFKKQIEDKRLRLKVAITIAILTIPWTFIIPTKWIYHGLY